MAVVRTLSPYVAHVIVANPLQVKAIAHAHVKTDKIDAGVLASLRAADFLPEVWLPDPDTERLRRLVARQPGCPASHADQERGARDPARSPDPALPACRPVRAPGPGLAGATGHA